MAIEIEDATPLTDDAGEKDRSTCGRGKRRFTIGTATTIAISTTWYG